ncbi:MAG: hypothetical protein CM1200mP10_20460 [Candidatus Neomarinimicrobiota bacterium]|nr:MAG: hypothetical protein CM1200mP10_20460 [Candidatus Neomarinimicrobiota bacterium]
MKLIFFYVMARGFMLDRKENMVINQLRKRGINDTSVLDAIRTYRDTFL